MKFFMQYSIIFIHFKSLQKMKIKILGRFCCE